MSLRYPLDNFTTSQGFGGNRDYYQQYGQIGHNGLDLAAPVGTPVFAADDGTIKFEGWGQNNSWMGVPAGICIIEDVGGVYVGYAHLSGTTINAGDTVSKGQLIGYVGETGAATGPHLHFEVIGMPPNFNNGYAGRIEPTQFIDEPTPTAEPVPQPEPAPVVDTTPAPEPVVDTPVAEPLPTPEPIVTPEPTPTVEPTTVPVVLPTEETHTTSDFSISGIRTYVPIVVGGLGAWLSLKGIVLDSQTVLALGTGLGGLIAAVYYFAIRLIEKKYPQAGVLLGSANQPTYSQDPTIKK